MKLRLSLKSKTGTQTAPLSLKEQLAALQAVKGRTLTRGEIKQLKHKHEKAERAYRKSQQQQYQTPQVRKTRTCTANVDAANAANRGSGSTQQQQPLPPLPSGYVKATAEELAEMNPGLFGKRKK